MKSINREHKNNINTQKRKRVIFRTGEPAPYRIPLFNYLATAGGYKFSVFFNASNDPIRGFTIPQNVLFDFKVIKGYCHYYSGKKNREIKRRNYINLIFREISKHKPDLIISHDFGLASLQCYLYCKLFNIPYITFSAASCFTERNISPFQRMIRIFIIAGSQAHIAISSNAADYIRSFKKHSDRICMALQTFDTKKFEANVEREKTINKREAPQLRLLYVGRLVRGKGVFQLLKLSCILNLQNIDIAVDLVGDGNDRREVEKYIRDYNLEKVVQVHGWINYRELYKKYAIADIFIFLSLEDVFALVINEAMAAGLPIICSKFAGAARDLVKEGKNGYIVDPYNIQDIVNKILFLIKQEESRKKYGKESLNIIKQYPMELFGQKINKAIEDALMDF